MCIRDSYLFYLQGITDAGPVRAGLVGCVEPVSATVISAVWLGTPVGVVDVVGCAMIIGMVFLVTEREEGSGGAASSDGAAYDLPPVSYTHLDVYKRQGNADRPRTMPNRTVCAQNLNESDERMFLPIPRSDCAKMSDCTEMIVLR